MSALDVHPKNRFSAAALEDFASSLFFASGMDRDKSDRVAHLLVLTDKMGRATHGLAQCGAYLDQISKNLMTTSGQPDVIRDTGATIVWDGCYLPGLWLMDEAMELALSRVKTHGVVTFACRQSHHIGCLATLAKKAADRGCYATLASSGPHTKAVAPFGGKQGLFSPNPFAFAFPATQFPVLIDISASLTTISAVREATVAGRSLGHEWLLDSDGKPSSDPSIVESEDNRGTLMLLGGEAAGHKGFGLALMVEALTQGLSGHGRRDMPGRWGASVYMQIIDPAFFAGRQSFLDQMDFFVERCHATAPIDPSRPVRLPGEQADRKIKDAETRGVEVSRETMTALKGWAQLLNVKNALF